MLMKSTTRKFCDVLDETNLQYYQYTCTIITAKIGKKKHKNYNGKNRKKNIKNLT